MTIWIVYQAADRLIVGVFGTAADAAARVSVGTGLVATAGLTTAAALEAQPGQFYLANRTISSDKPPSDVELLQQRVWQRPRPLDQPLGLASDRGGGASVGAR